MGIGLDSGVYMGAEAQSKDVMTLNYCTPGLGSNQTANYLIKFEVEVDAVYTGEWNLTGKIAEGPCGSVIAPMSLFLDAHWHCCSLSLCLAVDATHCLCLVSAATPR